MWAKCTLCSSLPCCKAMVASDAGVDPVAAAVSQYGALYILAITAAASIATEGIMWLWAYRTPSFRSLKVWPTM